MRLIMVLFISGASACAQLTVSPQIPIVQEGQTQAFTASPSSGVTWSMASGSVGSINSSTGVYTAPSHVAVGNSLGGCAVGSADNVFNTRIDNLPVVPILTGTVSTSSTGNTVTVTGGSTFITSPSMVGQPISIGGVSHQIATYISSTQVTTFDTLTSATGLSYAYGSTDQAAALDISGSGTSHAIIALGWHYNVGTFPTTALSFFYTTAYNAFTWELPPWPMAVRESGYFSDPQDNEDRHLFAVDPSTCEVYEMYNNYPAGTQAPTCSLCTAQSGWQVPSASFQLPTLTPPIGGGSGGSTSASGLPFSPITLHVSEVKAGAVKHALAMTFPNGFITQYYVWPATSSAGSFGGRPGTFSGPTYGARIRLKSSFNISTFSATAQVILIALQHYGAFITDGGGDWQIESDDDLSEDPLVASAMLELFNTNLGTGNWEVVDESSLMVSATDARVLVTNAYVTPPAYAVVVASSGSGTGSSQIALQGVAVNPPTGNGIWIQQATPAQMLSVPVAGSTNTAVTWAMSPTVGTLNSSTGLYTPPASGITSPSSTTITATSVADGAVSTSFPLTVMPPGPIRIITGGTTVNPAAPNSMAPTYGPDTSGHLWWQDQSVERGTGVKTDNWFPASNWPGTPDIYLVQTNAYNDNDTWYRWYVPNGNYVIDYYVALGVCFDPNNYVMSLEANSQTGLQAWSPAAGYTATNDCFFPVHTAISTTVTNNFLYFSLRRKTYSIFGGITPNAPVTLLSAISFAQSSGAVTSSSSGVGFGVN